MLLETAFQVPRQTALLTTTMAAASLSDEELI